MAGNPARWWIATLNNPELTLTEYFDRFYRPDSMRYIAGQTEVGANGTPHFQFVCCLDKP